MNRKFDSAYVALAKVGACDSPGGMEYQRVRHEWVQDGRPADVKAFIRERANLGPSTRICEVVLPGHDDVWASIDVDDLGNALYGIEEHAVGAAVYRDAITTAQLSISCCTLEAIEATLPGEIKIVQGEKLKLPEGPHAGRSRVSVANRRKRRR